MKIEIYGKWRLPVLKVELDNLANYAIRQSSPTSNRIGVFGMKTLLTFLLSLVIFAAVLFYFSNNVVEHAPADPEPRPGRNLLELISQQLYAINHLPDSINQDGENVTIRIRVSSTLDIQRPICNPEGWPFGGQKIRFDETLRMFRRAGVKRIQIVGDKETLLIQINQEGMCENGIADIK